jgi:CDGSH-type Zn-finger protein
MSKPEIPQTAPYAVDLEAEKNYFWCACGQSSKQPFCDGSHKTTEFKPVVFTASKNGKAHLCGCKHTKNPPFCDGTHKTL